LSHEAMETVGDIW